MLGSRKGQKMNTPEDNKAFKEKCPHWNPHCHQCGKQLDPEKVKWLELNCHTHELVEPGTAEWSNTEESQGCFEFGPDCYKRVLKTQKCNWKE